MYSLIDHPRDRHVAAGLDAPAPLAVGIVGAVAAAMVALAARSPMGVAIGAVVVFATLAAVADARTARLPDRLVALTALPAALLALGLVVDGGSAAPLAAGFAGAAAAAGPLLAMHLVSPNAIGFGDVKFAAALGLALGLVDWRLAMVALCVAAGSTAAAGLVTHRRELPLGPGLLVGSAAVLVVAAASGALR